MNETEISGQAQGVLNAIHEQHTIAACVASMEPRVFGPDTQPLDVCRQGDVYVTYIGEDWPAGATFDKSYQGSAVISANLGGRGTAAGAGLNHQLNLHEHPEGAVVLRRMIGCKGADWSPSDLDGPMFKIPEIQPGQKEFRLDHQGPPEDHHGSLIFQKPGVYAVTFQRDENTGRRAD